MSPLPLKPCVQNVCTCVGFSHCSYTILYLYGEKNKSRHSQAGSCHSAQKPELGRRLARALTSTQLEAPAQCGQNAEAD